MEFDIKFDKKMLVEMANRVLDEYEYNGKTIREWADLIANPKTNADRFRSLTDEGLATLISENIDCGVCENVFGLRPCSERCCPDFWLDWLRQEVPS